MGWQDAPVVPAGGGWAFAPVVDMHAETAKQIDNDPISQGARNFTSGMSGMEKFNAGAGKAFSDIGLGIRQRLGFSPREEAAEARRLDAPLMKSGAGIAGNIGGNVALLAPAALVPGAATVPGAAALGGLIGALQPSTGMREDVTNIGLGAAGGAVGQKVANLAGAQATTQQAQNLQRVARDAQKTAAAQQANKAGFVIPPEDIGQGGGLVTRLMQGAGGKIKTAQDASWRNQKVVSDLARQELGIAPTAPIDAAALNNIRTQAGQAYAAVENVGTITPGKTFTDALDKIVAPYVRAAKSFPNSKPNPIVDEINALRTGAFDAADAVAKIKTLRADADAAYAGGNKELGKSLKAGASALEQAIEDHLAQAGPSPLLNAFREARQTIAKTYSVQKALNSQTGDVSAAALAKQLEKGAPLSGNLLSVAQSAQAFPRAFQSLKEAPKSYSPFDMGVALLGAGGGNAAPAVAMGARPLVRNAMLSAPAQRAAIEAAGTPQNANMLLRALANEQLTLPVGYVGANMLAQRLAQ